MRFDHQSIVMVSRAVTPELWNTVKDIVSKALEQAPGERSGYVEQACAGNAGLRAEVDSLLAFHDASDFMEVDSLQRGGVEVLAGEAPEDDAADGAIGMKIGPYQVTELIGEGGVGAVYLASRIDDEFHSRVAIKVLKRGMESPVVSQGFLRERQIL